MQKTYAPDGSAAVLRQIRMYLLDVPKGTQKEALAQYMPAAFIILNAEVHDISADRMQYRIFAVEKE